ncbi:MAG: protein kinase domain-containing protein, partial [Planctomycetia bacterium]
RLGRGGMGEVFEAIDPATGETVAVKILRSHLVDDPGVRQRFESEIEALKNLRHPGIVRMLAFGAQDDEPYFAMEFVRGRSLEQVLRAGRRFTWRETVTVAGEVARALKAAHDLGIIHRDLKPANLLVVESIDAGSDTALSVKLADFGIAKLFGGAAHTAHNHGVGTAEFMAPEQAAGRPLDHRADLYALGLVMYAMMTGSSPFRGTQLTEIFEKQRNAVPPRLAGIVKEIPAELDALVARLLAKDPARRPASALALSRLLSAVETLHPPGDATATPPAASAPDAAPRSQSVATAVGTHGPIDRGVTAAGGREAGPPRPQHPTAPATAGPRRGASRPPGDPDPLAVTQPRPPALEERPSGIGPPSPAPPPPEARPKPRISPSTAAVHTSPPQRHRGSPPTSPRPRRSSTRAAPAIVSRRSSNSSGRRTSSGRRNSADSRSGTD